MRFALVFVVMVFLTGCGRAPTKPRTVYMVWQNEVVSLYFPEGETVRQKGLDCAMQLQASDSAVWDCKHDLKYGTLVQTGTPSFYAFLWDKDTIDQQAQDLKRIRLFISQEMSKNPPAPKSTSSKPPPLQ